MGSWNGTCFLSHLSITNGDRVVMQLLVPNTGKKPRDYVDLDAYTRDMDPRDINGSCHTNDELNPFAPVLTGIYNDYGSMEQVEKNTALIFFKQYVKALVANKQLVSLAPVDKWLGRIRDKKDGAVVQGIDATFPVDVDDIDEFLNMVERGSILVRTIFGHWVRLRFVMMHADIYDGVVAEMSKAKDWQGKRMFDAYDVRQREIVDYYVHGAMPEKKDDGDNNFHIAKDLLDGAEKIAKHIGEDTTKIQTQRKVMFSMFAREMLWKDFSYSEYRSECDDYLRNFCEDTKNKKHVEILISSRYDMLATAIYLMQMRRAWTMTSGCGSQDDNIDVVAKHNTMVNRFIKDYKKALKKRYGE